MARQLVSLSTESVLRARLKRLNDRLETVALGQSTGRLGPCVVRARLHYIEHERKLLARQMRQLGYGDVE